MKRKEDKMLPPLILASLVIISHTKIKTKRGVFHMRSDLCGFFGVVDPVDTRQQQQFPSSIHSLTKALWPICSSV